MEGKLQFGLVSTERRFFFRQIVFFIIGAVHCHCNIQNLIQNIIEFNLRTIQRIFVCIVPVFFKINGIHLSFKFHFDAVHCIPVKQDHFIRFQFLIGCIYSCIIDLFADSVHNIRIRKLRIVCVV